MARYLATKFTAPERCLVIGDAEAADAVQAKLRLTGVRHRRRWSRGSKARRGRRHPGGARRVPPQALLYGVMAEKCIHRVILAPGRSTRDRCCTWCRELSDLNVSGQRAAGDSAGGGSSVELDHIHGLTLLGVKTFEMSRSLAVPEAQLRRLRHRASPSWSCHR